MTSYTRSGGKDYLGSWSFFLIIFSSFLLFLRSASWNVSIPLNVDESVMMAAVLRGQDFGWLPWRDFDTTTIGPITIWFLGILSYVLGGISYEKLHFWASVLLTYSTVLAVHMVYSLRGACVRCGCLAAVFALGIYLMSNVPDYLHFSSGLLPLAFLTTASWFILRLLALQGPLKGLYWSLGLSGVLSGLAILSKLQSLPIALYLAIAGPIFLALRLSNPRLGFRLVAISLGGLLLPILMLSVILLLKGYLLTAINSYVLATLSYGFSKGPDPATIVKGEYALSSGYTLCSGWWVFGSSLLLLIPILVLFMISQFLKQRDKKSSGFYLRARLVFYFLSGWLLSTLFALCLPYHKFIHHGVFLISPIIVLFSYCLSQVGWISVQAQRFWHSSWRWLPIMLMPTFFVLTWLALSAPELVVSLRLFGADWGKYLHGSNQDRESLQEVCDFILKNTGPGDSVVVWGWVPEIYTFTQRPIGSRHIISHFLIEESLGQKRLLCDYIRDIEQNKPVLFIDGLCPAFHLWWLDKDYQKYRAGRRPQLKEVLDKSYKKVCFLNSGAIIYRRVR